MQNINDISHCQCEHEQTLSQTITCKTTTTTTVSKMSDEEMQQQMELQLHEQYAQNNNAYFGSVVTLFATLLVVIGVYGYVYIKTDCYFSSDFGALVNPLDEYYLDVLLLSALVSLFVLKICHNICIYQGISQRCEQFVIDAIRRKYYGKDIVNGSKFVFHPGYHPYNKRCSEIVQGLYNLFRHFIYWAVGIIIGSVIIKFLFIAIINSNNIIPVRTSITGIIEGLIFLLCLMGMYLDSCRYYRKRTSIYRRLNNYYSAKLEPKLS